MKALPRLAKVSSLPLPPPAPCRPTSFSLPKLSQSSFPSGTVFDEEDGLPVVRAVSLAERPDISLRPVSMPREIARPDIRPVSMPQDTRRPDIRPVEPVSSFAPLPAIKPVETGQRTWPKITRVEPPQQQPDMKEMLQEGQALMDRLRDKLAEHRSSQQDVPE